MKEVNGSHLERLLPNQLVIHHMQMKKQYSVRQHGEDMGFQIKYSIQGQELDSMTTFLVYESLGRLDEESCLSGQEHDN